MLAGEIKGSVRMDWTVTTPPWEEAKSWPLPLWKVLTPESGTQGARPVAGRAGEQARASGALRNKAFRANDALKRKGTALALWSAGWPPEAPFNVSTITCRNHAAAPRAGLTRRQARMPGEAHLAAV